MSDTLLDFNSTFKPPEFQSGMAVRIYCPHMVTTWNDRLRAAFEEKRKSGRERFTARMLSDVSGVPYNSVTKYLKGNTSQPRGDRVRRLAEALDHTEQWIRYGDQPESFAVRLLGWVGAAESWHPLDSEDEYVEISLYDEDAIALEVRGMSMAPVYNPGDVIVCSRKYGHDISRAIGKDCVVQTTDGELLVKKLLRDSSSSKLFRLRSYNTSIEDREHVALEWAAPVSLVKRA
ncbi:S24 family peptidase [Xanthobacter oligotrophicus]|uniref:S24 family peptidase n=1 Tax=Xanthobacter oligotrophicus TaxID=2607286 RepID=A0ABW6ZPS3_9HYPH